MSNAMMPPPLPGYPAPLQSPSPQPAQAQPPAAPGYPMPIPTTPQGYPGPAIATPVYGQGVSPAAPQIYPGFNGVPANSATQASQPFDVDIGNIGSLIAAATDEDRIPQPLPGQYVWEIISTEAHLHPRKKRFTFFALLKVVVSNNPANPIGAEVMYVEGLEFGSARAQSFLIAASGFPSKSEHHQAMRNAQRDPKQEITLLANAAATPSTQQPNNHYPPNPLRGRHVAAAVQMGERIVKSGPDAGVKKTFRVYYWSPA